MSNKEKLAQVYESAKPFVDNVLLAMARAQLERERVDKIYNAILADGVYMDDQGNQILDNNRAYRINDKQAADYYKLCDLALREAGYDLPDVGYCPALMAEEEQREAERQLVDAVAPLLGITRAVLMLNFDSYKRFIDLTIKTIVNHPDYKSPLAA